MAAALSLITVAAAVADQSPPGAAGQSYARSRSYLRTRAGVRQAWFVCSPLDGADQTVVGLPMAGQKLWIVQPLSGEAPDIYKLGRPDPGAGQIYWPLGDKAGKEVGALHAFNPGVLGEGRVATTPTFISIRIAGAQLNCRWLEGTRLLGFSNKRVIEITSEQGGLEYQSFDYKDAGKARKVETDSAQQSTTPSLDIKGGRGDGGRMRFENQGFVYEVTASSTDARITISRAGRRIAVEPLMAWTLGSP